MSVVLEIQELNKIYKKNQRLALDDLSLSVECWINLRFRWSQWGRKNDSDSDYNHLVGL